MSFDIPRARFLLLFAALLLAPLSLLLVLLRVARPSWLLTRPSAAARVAPSSDASASSSTGAAGASSSMGSGGRGGLTQRNLFKRARLTSSPSERPGSMALNDAVGRPGSYGGVGGVGGSGGDGGAARMDLRRYGMTAALWFASVCVWANLAAIAYFGLALHSEQAAWQEGASSADAAATAAAELANASSASGSPTAVTAAATAATEEFEVHVHEVVMPLMWGCITCLMLAILGSAESKGESMRRKFDALRHDAVHVVTGSCSSAQDVVVEMQNQVCC